MLLRLWIIAKRVRDRSPPDSCGTSSIIATYAASSPASSEPKRNWRFLWSDNSRERRSRTLRPKWVCKTVVVSHIFLYLKFLIKILSVSKWFQHFSRLVTKLYMEFVREFDISQQKVNHFPKKDGRGRPCNPQWSLLQFIIHLLNASSYSTLNASKNRKYLKMNNLEKHNIYCHALRSCTPHN